MIVIILLHSGVERSEEFLIDADCSETKIMRSTKKIGELMIWKNQSLF